MGKIKRFYILIRQTIENKNNQQPETTHEMVEATGVQDRGVQYASYRTDKQPDPGYSAELMNNDTP